MCKCTGSEEVHGSAVSGRLQKHLLEPLRNALHTGEVAEKVHIHLDLHRGDPLELLRSLLGIQPVDDTCLEGSLQLGAVIHRPQ